MVVTEVTQVGNPVIRKRSRQVADLKKKDVQRLIKDLTDSMRHHELVGMAAPQLGKNVRVFVTEIRETKLRKGDKKKDIDSLRVFINPRITSASKKMVHGWEGCGSVACAGLFGKVQRHASVTIDALNEKGELFCLKAPGLLARVVQHEMDHLNGVVFTDKADAKTHMSKNEYLKMRRK